VIFFCPRLPKYTRFKAETRTRHEFDHEELFCIEEGGQGGAFFGALFAGVFKVPFVVAMHEIQPEHEGKVIGHVGRAGLEI
jgi:hypothetical protein